MASSGKLKSFLKGGLFWAAGVFTFTAALAATAPASLLKHGLRKAPGDFSYLRIEGTIWNGVIREASLNGADLGDVSFSVHALAFLKGRVEASMAADGRDVFGSGRLAATFSGEILLSDADLRFNLTTVSRRYALMGAPIEGAASIRVDKLSYSASGCAAAAGEIWTDVLRGPARVFDGEAFDLSGPLGCEDGDLKVALTGSGGEGSASLEIALRPDLTYELVADASPRRSEVDDALRMLGFEQGPGGLTYGASGVFRGV